LGKYLHGTTQFTISRKFYFPRKAKKEHRVNLIAIQEAIKQKGD